MKLKSSLCVGVFITMNLLSNGQATIEEREQKARQVNQLYHMAEQAYKENNIEVARDTLRTILAEQPGHAHSIALLRKIKLNGSRFELIRRKNQFDAVVIKFAEYKNMNLKQALKTLNMQVITVSKGKVVPNLVIKDPKKYLGDEKIDLELKNVPAGVVLEHLMRKTGCSAKFNKYTISVSPRASAHKKRPQATAPSEIQKEAQQDR